MFFTVYNMCKNSYIFFIWLFFFCFYMYNMLKRLMLHDSVLIDTLMNKFFLERFSWILLPAGRSFFWKGYLSKINVAFFLYVYILAFPRECSALRRKKRVALGVIDTKPLKRRETLGNKNFTQDISRLPFLPCRLPTTSVN